METNELLLMGGRRIYDFVMNFRIKFASKRTKKQNTAKQ